MKILFASSEAAPFVKSGGLGDVLGALPPQLSKNDGVEVAVVLPYYGRIKYNPEFNIEYVTSFYMPLAWRSEYVGIFKSVIETRGVGKNKGSRVTYYFIDNERYFNRGNLYGYNDDGERFAYFSKAVLEMLIHVDYDPDIIHANDWQTGFLPLFLKAHYGGIDKFKKIKSVYTIHNIEYQGKAEPSFLSEVLGVDVGWRNVCTQDNMINAMKTAIVLCDKLTTVSETYSHELQYAYFAHGLEHIISENAYKTCGIVNGIDTKLYDPSKDKKLEFNYKPSDLSGKAQCKAKLQSDLGLPVNSDVPMVAMITRLVKHKGLELVEWVADRLATMGIQFVVLGTGDAHYEDMFKFLAYTHPQSVSANICFDSTFANRLYAASDFFLMPSKSEPCGLSQMIAMRYGSIPIVRETGGLVDTVTPLNTETLDGIGFTFKVFNAHDMLHAVERAKDFFYDREKMDKHRRSIMKIDTSWKKPAEKYFALYKEIVG